MVLQFQFELHFTMLMLLGRQVGVFSASLQWLQQAGSDQSNQELLGGNESAVARWSPTRLRARVTDALAFWLPPNTVTIIFVVSW